MSASRSFLDVLVGKLTAYVDASSRPAPSIHTPPWVATFSMAPGVAGVRVAHAYASQSAGAPSAPEPSRPDTADIRQGASSATRTVRRRVPSAPAPVRSPAELTAIGLLHRLGATTIDAASTDDELRTAWRSLLLACHPDAHPHVQGAERAALTARVRAVLRVKAILDRSVRSIPQAA